ncbi:hypothetical protein ACLB2K_011557 [Fragaria x ananassa]
MKVMKKASSSLAWKGILDQRDLIQKGMRWTIGDVVACAATYHCVTPNRINSSPSSTGSRLNIKWNPPPQGQVKIKFDGSIIQQTSDVVAEFILRDDVGCPLIAFARKLGKTTVPIAEPLHSKIVFLERKKWESKIYWWKVTLC